MCAGGQFPPVVIQKRRLFIGFLAPPCALLHQELEEGASAVPAQEAALRVRGTPPGGGRGLAGGMPEAAGGLSEATGGGGGRVVT